MGNESKKNGSRRTNRACVRLLREDGQHKCWVSRIDRQRLIEGGHVEVVDDRTVRLMSTREKAERGRLVSVGGVKRVMDGRGLGRMA